MVRRLPRFSLLMSNICVFGYGSVTKLAGDAWPTPKRASSTSVESNKCHRAHVLFVVINSTAFVGVVKASDVFCQGIRINAFGLDC